jgi:hypothetical protein
MKSQTSFSISPTKLAEEVERLVMLRAFIFLGKLTDVRIQEAAGTVKMELNHTWLRGTEDTGCHTHNDKLTVDPRKLKSLKGLVSHISNFNHWMMSHDNIWPVLPSNHPLVSQARSSMHDPRLQTHSQVSTGGDERVRVFSCLDK